MNETPKLTYIISSLETGGAEIGMARLLDGLSPEAFNVTVVTLYGGDKTILPDLPNDIKIVDLDIRHKYRLDKLLPVVPILQKTDILIGSVYHAEVLSRILGTLMGVDTVLNWAHTTEFKTRIRKKVDESTIGLCNGILADSEAVSFMLTNEQDVDPDKVWTVPIAGISIDKYTGNSTPLATLDTSAVGGQPLDSVPDDAAVIGIVGSLIDAKNHDIVLDIASRLSNQDIHIVIAGDGPRRQELIDTVVDQEITNVTLLGNIAPNTVSKLLSTIDIYFQPSLYEGLCIAVIEAMAAGNPIVASNVGEIPSNIDHGVHGFVTKPNDIDGFERYLRRLINDPHLQTQMGKTAREEVRDKYSQAALVENFQAVIDEVHFSQ